jgi:hypothetical protein
MLGRVIRDFIRPGTPADAPPLAAAEQLRSLNLAAREAPQP